MDVGRVDGTEDGFWSEKGRWTDSVWKVWKDVRAGKGEEGLEVEGLAGQSGQPFSQFGISS